MKKIVVLMVFLSVASLSYAQRYVYEGTPSGKVETGASTQSYSPAKKWELSLAGFYTSDAKKHKGIYNMNPIDDGGTANIALLYNIAPWLGVGAEASYTAFSEQKMQNLTTGASFTYKDGNTFGGGVAAKVRLNPSHPVRFYLPVGAGYSKLSITAENASYLGSISEESTENRWYAYAGAGLEVDLSEICFLGAEYRYSYYFGDKVFGEKIAFHNVGLRIGFRF